MLTHARSRYFIILFDLCLSLMHPQLPAQHAPAPHPHTHPQTPPVHTKKTSWGAGSTSRGPACPALRRRNRTGSSSTRATRSRCGAPTARSMTTPSKCVRAPRSPARPPVRWFFTLLCPMVGSLDCFSYSVCRPFSRLWLSARTCCWRGGSVWPAAACLCDQLLCQRSVYHTCTRAGRSGAASSVTTIRLGA